ncbi:hypothetical protein D3C80_1708550 [compost metagenome]
MADNTGAVSLFVVVGHAFTIKHAEYAFAIDREDPYCLNLPHLINNALVMDGDKGLKRG